MKEICTGVGSDNGNTRDFIILKKKQVITKVQKAMERTRHGLTVTKVDATKGFVLEQGNKLVRRRDKIRRRSGS